MIKKLLTISILLIIVNLTFADCSDFSDEGQEYPLGVAESTCASYQESCEPVETTICTFELICSKANGGSNRQVYFYKDFTSCNWIVNIDGNLRCDD